jgi:uncharacterized protein YjbJ (UPF0337 family)
MNWNQIEENWKQLKGNAKKKWGKLTDDELDVKVGKRKPATGKAQNTRSNKKDDVKH